MGYVFWCFVKMRTDAPNRCFEGFETLEARCRVEKIDRSGRECVMLRNAHSAALMH